MRKKQLWALLLVLSMLCSLALPAYAEDGEGETPALPEDEVSLGDLSPLPIEAPSAAEIQAKSITINSTNFPDTKFQDYLKAAYGKAQTSWFTTTYTLDPDEVDVIDCPGKGIASLEGIELFPNLVTLNCSNNSLSTLDLSSNTIISTLDCSGNTNLSKVNEGVNTPFYNTVSNETRSEESGVVTYAGDFGSFTLPANTSLTNFHSVRFDLNGGFAEFPLVQIVADNDCAIEPCEPEYDSGDDEVEYVFWAWYAGSFDEDWFEFDTPVTEDLVLKARYVKLVYVTLDYNGADPDGNWEYLDFCEGMTLDGELPTPVWEGRFFLGWMLDGQPYDETTPLTESITLVASWADAYTLHFDRSNPHDDQKALDDITVIAEGKQTASFAFMNYDTVLPPLLNDDRANGWQFIGWDTDPNAAIDEVDFPRWTPDSPSGLKGPYEVALSEDNSYVTLYAIYAKIPTVTVHKNDGSNAVATGAIISRGAFYTRLYIGTFTRSGFDLLGYSTDPNAAEPDEGLEKSTPNQTPNVYYYTTEDVELYAVWGAKRYTLSYHGNGGFGALPASVSFTMENKPEIVLPSAEDLGLTKAHRVFLGWSVDASKSDQNCNKVPSGLYAPGDTLDPAVLSAKNHTIYAVWQYEAIKISLDLNGYTGVYTPANGYPMYYNYGWTNGYDVPAGRPVTPLSYPGDKAFPEGYAAADGAANPFCYWMDKETKQFYLNGNLTNRNNGSAVLPNDKDTELLGVWKYAFLRYYDANGEVALVDAVVFDADTRTYTRPTVKDGTARVGYDFLGWATEKGGEVVYQPGDTIDSLAEISFYPVYQLNATTVVLRSASVVFDGLIRLRYYFTLPDPLLDAGDSYLVFYKRGKEMNRTALKDGTPVNKSGDPSNKSFDLSVVAKAFDDEIVIKILDADGNVYPMVTENGADYTEIGFPYSVRQYAEYLQDNSSSATMQALAKALGEYGDAARIYFGGSGTVSDDVTAVTLDDFDGCAVKKSGVLPAGVTGKSISVMFEADNSLRIYLDFAPEYSPDDYSFTIDGEPATMQENADHKFYLTVGNIAAKNLDVFHTFTVSDGVRSFSIEASVLSYARLLVSGNKPNSQNLGKALYLYNLAADALFSNEALNADA